MKQSHSITMTYNMIVKKETDLEECDAAIATNLPVVPLHYLKVSLT